MLTTQQFADLCDTTKKTILYYDKIGLITPNLRTPLGRKYEIRQVLRFQKIALLKSFGFPLDKIISIIDSEDFNHIFRERVEKLELEQERLSQKLSLIQGYLKNLRTKQFLINPKQKTVEPYYYYAIRKTGRYIDISQFDRELSYLIEDITFKHIYFTVFHTPTYSPDNCEMTIGAINSAKNPKQFQNVNLELMLQHKVISYIHLGSYRYLSYVWQFLDQYVFDKKYKIRKDLPCRELYIKGGLVEKNEDKLVTELQVPIL